MQRAPDCKIYVCSGSSVNSYSVIKNPDEKGLACNFDQHGIQLPYVSGVGNFPNFPNFRINDEDICDPTLTSIFDAPIEIVNGLKVSPNPAYDVIELTLPYGREMKYVEIYTLDGTQVYSRLGSYGQLELNDLHTGMYVVKAGSKEGKIMVERLVKM